MLKHKEKHKSHQMMMHDGVWGWQWHQLDHMETICTSIQTDNLTAQFLQATCSSWRPTKAGNNLCLKWKSKKETIYAVTCIFNVSRFSDHHSFPKSVAMSQQDNKPNNNNNNNNHLTALCPGQKKEKEKKDRLKKRQAITGLNCIKRSIRESDCRW